jgi:hypothetical protein
MMHPHGAGILKMVYDYGLVSRRERKLLWYVKIDPCTHCKTQGGNCQCDASNTFFGFVFDYQLNSDISLVRNLDSTNFDPSIGRATCTFEDNSATASLTVCPHVEGALQIAAEFNEWVQA